MYLVRLQFEAGGPAVTGKWADGATARRTWRDGVGLYGSDEKVAIHLAEESDGDERGLMAGAGARCRDGIRRRSPVRGLAGLHGFR